MQLCARYYEIINYDADDPKTEFYVNFYIIKGIRYHRISNKKICASLILSYYPVISLNSKKDENFFGIFDNPLCEYNRKHRQQSKGMSYYVNKYSFINENFKNFIANLFIYYGKENKKYILKDIGRTIQNNGYFLPEISCNDIVKCHTPKDILYKCIDIVNNLNINYNRIDLNKAYLFLKVFNYNDKRSYKILLDMDYGQLKECICDIIFFNGFDDIRSFERLVAKYYHKKFALKYPDYSFYDLLKDYINQSLELGEKVRLDLSLQKLTKLHDRVSFKYRKIKFKPENKICLVKNDSNFDDLEKSLLCYKGFKRIKHNVDLYEEGENQHNCVFSRRNMILNDEIAIFHWDNESESITIQFSKKRKKYIIDEMRAKYNRNCSAKSKEFINQKLIEINSRHNLMESIEYI